MYSWLTAILMPYSNKIVMPKRPSPSFLFPVCWGSAFLPSLRSYIDMMLCHHWRWTRGENIRMVDDEGEFRSEDTSLSGTIEGDQRTHCHFESSRKKQLHLQVVSRYSCSPLNTTENNWIHNRMPRWCTVGMSYWRGRKERTTMTLRPVPPEY